jgi:hypothetical protein
MRARRSNAQFIVKDCIDWRVRELQGKEISFLDVIASFGF